MVNEMQVTPRFQKSIVSVFRILLLFGILLTMIPAPLSDCSLRYDFWTHFRLGLVPLVPFLALLENGTKSRIVAVIIGAVGYFLVCYLMVEAWNMILPPKCL